jgi:glycosyltransferase involved in cell wall biosynthesis
VRILTVGLLFPPHHLGGYELVCEGVMREALARGHDVQVLVSDHRTPGVSEPDPLPVHRSLRSYMDASAQRAAALTPRQRLALERYNGAILERHLREFAPEAVSWWGMGGMSISLIERVRRKGVPAVLMVQDPWLSYGFQTDSWTRMTRRMVGLAPLLEPLCGVPIRYELERAGRFAFNSKHTQAVSEAAGIRPVQSTIVTPGIHRRYLQAAPERPWEWRLLHVGRVDPDKGIDLAIAALPSLPEQARLTIIGGGDHQYRQQLEDQARSLGVARRVRFLGPVATDLLRGHYEQADAVLFPIRWEEPWGLVPLEAMGVGRPVVAVPKGGALTYLSDERNALLIPPEDPASLAAAVQRLADDPGLRARLREGGIQTASEHSAARHDGRLVEEIERAGRRVSG